MSLKAYAPTFSGSYTSVVLVPTQDAPPTFADPFSPRILEETRRQRQAAHDAQVVREILAGCRQQRNCQNWKNRWFLTSWLFLLVQALGKCLLRS